MHRAPRYSNMPKRTSQWLKVIRKFIQIRHGRMIPRGDMGFPGEIKSRFPISKREITKKIITNFDGVFDIWIFWTNFVSDDHQLYQSYFQPATFVVIPER